MQETQTEKRALRYDFTAVEIHDMSIRLAQKNKEQVALDNEAKAVASQYSSKLKVVKSEIEKLSNQVTEGWELRDIDCDVLYHKPTQGKKTVIRKDTGKTVAFETMTDYEWNLFNQPQDELPPTEDAEAVTTTKTKRKRRKKNQPEPITGEPLALPAPAEDHADEVEFEEITAAEE